MNLLDRFCFYIGHLQYSFVLGLMLSQVTFDAYGMMFFDETYIAQIQTPSYSNNLTMEILEEFNAMGGGKIVSFSPIKNGRPVTITEVDPEDNILGSTLPAFTKCTITIRKGLPYAEYRETLLHEYLHCYGVGHTNDKRDLMYWAMIPVDKDANIKYHAEKLRKTFYE